MKKEVITIIGETAVTVIAEIWKDRNDKKGGGSNGSSKKSGR